MWACGGGAVFGALPLPLGSVFSDKVMKEVNDVIPPFFPSENTSNTPDIFLLGMIQ